jgi:hypothetical protein
MTLLLFGIALAALVATHVLLERRLAKLTRGILEREEARRVAYDELDRARLDVHYKQQKASVRTVSQNNRATLKLSDEVRQLHRDAVQIHQGVERMLKAAEPNG